MIYGVVPFIILGMLGYMFWRSAVRMRRDRVHHTRQATRSKYAFTPFHRARFLLGRAFRADGDEPHWQQEYRARLDEVKGGSGEPQGPA